MEKIVLSVLCLMLLGGCVTRERVVVVEGPVPGYQGFYPPANQAAYRVYPEYRPVPVPQPTPATPAYIPPPDLGPRQPIVYVLNPPLVYPPTMGFQPNVVYLPGSSPYVYRPTSSFVYRTYGPAWNWGGSWSHHHSFAPHHGYVHHSHSSFHHHH